MAHLHHRLPAPPRKDAKRPALARALRDGREKLNLSQPEVARRAGISMRYVQDIELGKRVPSRRHWPPLPARWTSGCRGC